jgi:hypothetical protein
MRTWDHGGIQVTCSAKVGWSIVILSPLVLVVLVANLTRRTKKSP